MTDPATVGTGTGYGRKKPSYDARPTEAGPGTPMAEAVRNVERGEAEPRGTAPGIFTVGADHTRPHTAATAGSCSG